jgi:steroid delta-isomerase-like uncharacterized protein
MSFPDPERLKARVGLVEEHVRCENRHDLDAVMATFGTTARYDDEPWADHRSGRDGVRSYYTDRMRALPDLAIEVRHRHVASDSIVLEVIIRGTHLGQWRGLPATGRRVEFPLCAVYTFDADDRLAGERILLRPQGSATPGWPLSRAAARTRAPRHRAKCSTS